MNRLAEHGNTVWLALLFIAVAVLCMVADTRGRSHDVTSCDTSILWRWLTALLWLMAVNLLAQGDVLFVTWIRDVARAGSWYEVRRPLQVGLLAILVAASAIVFKRKAQGTTWAEPLRRRIAETLAGCGMLVLLVIVLLRFISLHHTDRLLNARLAGPSLGRWLELVGLVLVGWGALHRLSRQPLARPCGPKDV